MSPVAYRRSSPTANERRWGRRGNRRRRRCGRGVVECPLHLLSEPSFPTATTIDVREGIGGEGDRSKVVLSGRESRGRFLKGRGVGLYDMGGTGLLLHMMCIPEANNHVLFQVGKRAANGDARHDCLQPKAVAQEEWSMTEHHIIIISVCTHCPALSLSLQKHRQTDESSVHAVCCSMGYLWLGKGQKEGMILNERCLHRSGWDCSENVMRDRSSPGVMDLRYPELIRCQLTGLI